MHLLEPAAMAAVDVQITRMQVQHVGQRAQQRCIGLAVYRRRLQAYAQALLCAFAVQSFNLCLAGAGNHQHLNNEFPVLGISEARMLGARPHSHQLKSPTSCDVGLMGRITLLLRACRPWETAKRLAGSEWSEPQGQPGQRVL